MPINSVADNFQVQQSAAGSNQAAAAELRDINKKEDDKKADSKSYTQKLLSKSSKDTGQAVLSDLVSKMAESGVKLEPQMFIAKATRHAKDEYEMMLKSDHESSSDMVDINSINQRINAAKKFGQGNKDGKGGQDPNSGVNVQKFAGTLEEFSTAFVQLLVSGGVDVKKKAEKLEQRLRDEGFGEKELMGLKANLRQSIRTQLAGQIRESLLKRFMSKEKTLEWVMNNREANRSIDFAFNSEKLGGWDFGGYNDNLQGTVNEQMRQISSEVRDFVNDELKNALVKKHLSPDSKTEKAADAEIKQLIEMGIKSGFNPNQFMASWKQTMNNIGICPPPPEAAQQSMIGQGSTTSDNNRREKTGYELTAEEEKDLFTNQLRSIYLQRAIKGSIFTNIETSFKIRKLKNGLIKLGVSFGDLEKIETEGRALAKVKSLEMLKEAYYERATFYNLSGPAFDMVESKIKSLLKNLDRLGMELTKTDLDSMRDKANYRMFDITRGELENNIIAWESNKSPYYEKKINMMIKLMKRLEEESQIDTDYDPEKRFASVASAA
ncbi:MAG TPA: hypothetical protein VMD02_01770 [Candidatus Omnitrophota bacterium]|nr:hypothetical protein [Candidatus Omnitrophota bacterium]